MLKRIAAQAAAGFDPIDWLASWANAGGIAFRAGDRLYIGRLPAIDRAAQRRLDLSGLRYGNRAPPPRWASICTADRWARCVHECREALVAPDLSQARSPYGCHRLVSPVASAIVSDDRAGVRRSVLGQPRCHVSDADSERRQADAPS